MKRFCKFSKWAVFFVLCHCFVLPGLAEEISSSSDYATLCASAERGDVQSQYLIGHRFYNGTEGSAKDYSQAVEWFRKAAENGHAKAQGYLGYIYVTVPGIATNPVEGFMWLRKAAETNEVSAQYDLGLFYEKGVGVLPDRFEAMDWYIKAAAQGHARARSALARLRRTADVARKGLVPDEWWMIPLEELIQKAEQGDAEAQENLGRRYKGYGGTAVDIEKARFWLEKAAAQTNQAARYSLSQLYVSTTNMAPDQAFYHCSLAAEGGYSPAQRELGEYYRDGFGTTPDRRKAFHWLCLAEQDGDSYAGESIYSLIKGRAAFTEPRKSRVAVTDYSPPPIELVVFDLDNQERTVKFIKYDPKTKQVQTDFQFGESTLLPLSAFTADSYPVIQIAWKKKVFESALRLNITRQELTKAECEELGYISGKNGSSMFRYEGVVYQLEVSIPEDADVLKNLDIESLSYYTTRSWFGSFGKEGDAREIEKKEKKSYLIKGVKPGVRYYFETDPLVVESYSTDRGVHYTDGSPTILESKILGVCVQVSCEMEDGTTIYRDVYEPSALKSKITK